MAAPDQRAILAGVLPLDIDQFSVSQFLADGLAKRQVVLKIPEEHVGLLSCQHSGWPTQKHLDARVAMHDQAVAGEHDAQRRVFQNGPLLDEQVLHFSLDAFTLANVLGYPYGAFSGVLRVNGFGTHMAIHGAAVFAPHGYFLIQLFPPGENRAGQAAYLRIVCFRQVEHRSGLADQLAVGPAIDFRKLGIAVLY